MAFARYSRDQSFGVLRANARFVLAMSAGSATGTILGGLILGAISSAVIVPLLVLLLMLSAIKLWRHD